MPTTRPTPAPTRDGESRLWVVWLSSALAAVLLTLGVNGTLGDWTSAVLDHDQNSAGTRSTTRVLEVTGPDAAGASTTCSSAEDTDNAASCEINLFGQGGVEQTGMAPGSTNTTIVTVTNTGDTDGSLKLDASACDDGTGSLCDKLRVTVACVGLNAIVGVPTTLTSFGAGSVITAGTLVPNAPSTCTFVTTLPVLATGWSGQTVDQTVTWSLTS